MLTLAIATVALAAIDFPRAWDEKELEDKERREKRRRQEEDDEPSDYVS